MMPDLVAAGGNHGDARLQNCAPNALIFMPTRNIFIRTRNTFGNFRLVLLREL
jgi:hypothetical protein